MNKLLMGACICAIAAGFVACGDDSSSTSASPVATLTLDDDILWQPSYGERAWTTFNTERNADNFWSLDAADGYLFNYTDSAEGGKSQMLFSITDSAIVAEIKNVYHWVKNEDTEIYEPSPYPYSGFGFYLAPNSNPVDVSSWEGICIVYQSTGKFHLMPKSANDQWYWRSTVPASSEKTVFQLKFMDDLELVSWSNDAEVSLEEALKTAMGFNIEFQNDLVSDETAEQMDACWDVSEPCEDFNAENTIRIYKIAKYGKCGE